MRHSIRLHAVFAICLMLSAWVCPSPALADAAVEPLGAAKILELVQPYIRTNTEVVVHADMARVDLNTAHDLVVAGIAAANLSPEDEKDANEAMQGFFDNAGTWTSEFLKAGGRHVIILVPSSNLGGEIIIAPLAAGANARAVEGLLFSGKADGPIDSAGLRRVNSQPAQVPEQGRSPNGATVYAGSWVRGAAVVGNAVVVGSKEAIDSASKDKPVDRPELAAALEPAGDAPARIAVIFTDPTRTLIEGLVGKTLPTILGGGPTSSLTRDVLWISASAQISPAASFSFCAQCRDAASATVANNALSAGLRFLSILPSTPGQPNWAALVSDLAPAVQDTRVVLAIDATGIQKMMPVVAVSMARARRQARVAQSMSNMRQLIMGCVVYAAANRGDWPDNLDVVVTKYLGGNKQILQNPQQPDAKATYTYVKPGKDQINRKASQTVVLYESDEKAKDVSTGFADGHVEHLTRERFEKMLLDTQSGNTDNGL